MQRNTPGGSTRRRLVMLRPVTVRRHLVLLRVLEPQDVFNILPFPTHLFLRPSILPLLIQHSAYP